MQIGLSLPGESLFLLGSGGNENWIMAGVNCRRLVQLPGNLSYLATEARPTLGHFWQLKKTPSHPKKVLHLKIIFLKLNRFK
jgi:hypothetical protein